MHAVRLAGNVNVDPTMPRVAGRQIHRCNAPADNPEQYYQRNMAVPFRWFAKRQWDHQHLQRWSPVAEAFTSRTPSIPDQVEHS